MTKAMFAHVLLLFLFTSKCHPENDVWNKNHELRQKLLKDYDKTALPQRNSNGTADVFVFFYPRAIWIDDQKETLVVDSWLSLEWIDKRLKWDYKDYGGLHEIHFGHGEIWKPDLSVYNNADITEIDHYGDIHFTVFSYGMVWWIPPAKMKTYCKLNLKFWPYDEHTCGIRLGSWTSHGLQITLNLFGNKTELSLDTYTNMSSSWEVKEASQHRLTEKFAGYEEFYQEIQFIFTLKRRSYSFTYCIVVPAVGLPLLLLFQFFLPVDHEKRFTIGCSVTLSVLIELMFLKFNIPRLGGPTPLIVEYYSELMILSVLTVGITAFLGRLAHPQNPVVAYPPPEIVKRLLAGPLAWIFCVNENAAKLSATEDLQEEEKESTRNTTSGKYSHQWLIIAKVADRLFFLILTVIFVLSLISFVAPVK